MLVQSWPISTKKAITDFGITSRDFGLTSSVLRNYDSRSRLRLGGIDVFASAQQVAACTHGHHPMLKLYWPVMYCSKNFSKMCNNNGQATQKDHGNQIAHQQAIANWLVANRFQEQTQLCK